MLIEKSLIWVVEASVKGNFVGQGLALGKSETFNILGHMCHHY